MMKRTVLILMVFFAMFLIFSPPKAEAFVDPISLSLLTPVALEAAQTFAPYAIKIGVGLARGSAHMARNFVNIFRLPFGACQSTLGFPWGQFGPGVRNMVRGSVAPVKLIGNVLMLPIYAVSAL